MEDQRLSLAEYKRLKQRHENQDVELKKKAIYIYISQKKVL